MVHCPRAYQERIIEQCVAANSLVVLPTGAGKTLIAAEVLLRVGVPAVFLVPTVVLVAQQCAALAEFTALDVQPYSGGKALPPRFDILVTTPSALLNAQQKPVNLHVQWARLRAVVFDEAHHVLKKHPYRTIALAIKAARLRSGPHILGLTAFFTYEVDDAGMAKVLAQLRAELTIAKVLTCSAAELRACGYHALGAKATLPFGALGPRSATPEGCVSRADRQPHEMFKTFIERYLARTGTAFGQRLGDAVHEMEARLGAEWPRFAAPLAAQKPVKAWAEAAHKAAKHFELTNPLLSERFKQLEHWYEALRLLVVSWEEDEWMSVTMLRMMRCDADEALLVWPGNTRRTMANVVTRFRATYARLEVLKETLVEEYVQRGDDFRGLLFVNQRIATHILEHFITTDPQLSPIFRTSSIYAASTPANPSFRVSKSDCAERLRLFGEGEVNLLITTVVAEEGLDVPQANAVIRFDAMEHAVSLVQGRGRARQVHSSFVVLSERLNRPAKALEKVEERQIELLKEQLEATSCG
eukprot:Selendium_serpulae@DN6236_c6_g2_i1.p1